MRGGESCLGALKRAYCAQKETLASTINGDNTRNSISIINAHASGTRTKTTTTTDTMNDFMRPKQKQCTRLHRFRCPQTFVLFGEDFLSQWIRSFFGASACLSVYFSLRCILRRDSLLQLHLNGIVLVFLRVSFCCSCAHCFSSFKCRRRRRCRAAR